MGALAPTKESTLRKPSESMLYVKIRTNVHRKARVRAILNGHHVFVLRVQSSAGSLATQALRAFAESFHLH